MISKDNRFTSWLMNISGSRRLRPGTSRMYRSAYGSINEDKAPEEYEDNGVGKLLHHEVFNGKLDTLEDLFKCIYEFDTKYENKNIVITMSNKDNSKFYQLDSGSVENGKMVMQLTAFDSTDMIEPVPVDWFMDVTLRELADDIETAYEILQNGILYEFASENKVLNIAEIALDQFRDPDSPDVFYFLHITFDETGKRGGHVSASSNSAPRTGAQLKKELESMSKRANRSSLMRQPMIFRIPSVSDPSAPDDLPDELKGIAGVMCVVDYASDAAKHVKVFMMRLNPAKDVDWALQEKGCSAESVIQTIESRNANKELFFIYDKKPYEIESIEAPAGKPISVILAPWGELDENRRQPKYENQILEWAKMCENPILDWPF